MALILPEDLALGLPNLFYDRHNGNDLSSPRISSLNWHPELETITKWTYRVRSSGNTTYLTTYPWISPAVSMTKTPLMFSHRSAIDSLRSSHGKSS